MISQRISLVLLFSAICLQPIAPTASAKPRESGDKKSKTDKQTIQTDATAELQKQCKVDAAMAEPDPATQALLLQNAKTCINLAASNAARESQIKKNNKLLTDQLKKSIKNESASPVVQDQMARQKAADEAAAQQLAAQKKIDDAAKKLHEEKEAARLEAAQAFAKKNGTSLEFAMKHDFEDPPAPFILGSSAPTTAAGIPTPTPAAGVNASQNAYATPNACAIGTGKPGRAEGQALLYVHRELLRQQEVEDDFGRRLGNRFLVYQVSITNASKDFQYEVGDISVDLKDVLLDQGAILGKNHATRQGSSTTLEMLRGVPEKGQDLDPRNLTLHFLQGIGSVGAAVSGLTPFSGVMGSAMANFNGAFIQAFTGIAPDHTPTQLNRLSDMAFTSNTLIGKLQTKTYAIFLPKSFVLTTANERAFKKDPRTLLNSLPLDQANVCVDGILLVQVAAAADPVLLPREANINPGAPITITSTTADAVIYYTDKGEVPTLESKKYTAAFDGPAAEGGQVTIKSFAVAPNLAPSNVIVRTFTAAKPAGNPTFKYDPTAKTLEIDAAANSPDDIIYYTTDGTAPDSASKRYTKPFDYTTGTTIKAVAIGPATSLSAVQPYP